MKRILTITLVSAAIALPAGIVAAEQAAPRPADKPPVAQAWLDIATFASPGMGSMGGMIGGMMGGMMGGEGGGATPLSAMLGGKSQGNQFGHTRFGGSGSFLDVTLSTSRNPNLSEALQAVPAASKLAPTLQLKVLPQAKPVREMPEDAVEEPKGKIKLYWGCGSTIRSGQPKVVDFSTGTTGQMAEIFKGRRATQRGTHSALGRPVWPNLTDKRLVPQGASLAGEHAFTGQGVPDDFRFNLPAQQDIMPPIALRQAVANGVTQLSWQPLPTARAYFIAAIGGQGDESRGAEMTLWTSSELPDSGFGLVDYQTNNSVDQWLKEKVLLPPTASRCEIPRGIFPEGSAGMLRMIAYGSEINLAYPPRPKDPKVAWEPDWAVKVRVKSVANSMLGMPDMGDEGAGDEAATDGEGPATGAAEAEAEPKKKKFSLKGALDAARQVVP
jgi:hypothetical protein